MESISNIHKEQLAENGTGAERYRPAQAKTKFNIWNQFKSKTKLLNYSSNHLSVESMHTL